ncbi:MAG: 3-deoxy-D-manno-octulosonate 8-phosphate phosphatase, YrbI family [Betaproteobacteria bacterium]|nr:3-deoxy-D-manno-octulosonate 8-phosphate phosphatase, YrbI family [Betaproteobacteria bacterium]
MQAIYTKAARVRLAIFDVDGILTDGSLYLTDGGEEIKAFNSLDGHGMKMLRESGVELAIITGRTSRIVELRAKNLGISRVYQGVADKAQAFLTLLAECRLDAAATAYMGDDVVDLPVMIRCGFSLTVPAAPLLVRQRADYVTRADGGRGAAREACELIMQAQGTLAPALEAYLK